MALTFHSSTLQQQLTRLWAAMEINPSQNHTAIILPSYPVFSAQPLPLFQAYEERMLDNLLFLTNPSLKIIFLSTCSIAPWVIDYYLQWLPGDKADYKKRFLHLPLNDKNTHVSLVHKILSHKEYLKTLQLSFQDPKSTYILPYIVSEDEIRLAEILDVPLYGAPHTLTQECSKSGCRKLFRTLNLPLIPGFEDIHTIDDIILGIQHLRSMFPRLKYVVLKLNHGVSGHGNAIIHLPASNDRHKIKQTVLNLKPVLQQISSSFYLQQLKQFGGVLEIYMENRKYSPSVQIKIDPLGDMKILSTTEQSLSGKKKQHFIGCRFPAFKNYVRKITQLALQIGTHLRHLGCIGELSIDFIISDQGNCYPVEINLRTGGVYFAIHCLNQLVPGFYDCEQAQFISHTGPKFFIENDSVKLNPKSIKQIITINPYDATLGKGVIYYMFHKIKVKQEIGTLIIADSRQEAKEIYLDTKQQLLL